MASSLVQLDHAYESGRYNVVTLIIQSLFNELLKGLDVLFVNDLRQHTESICAHDFIIALLDVL